ncbi:MAG TPA: hypothetical protein VFS33_00040 [Gemmatimonadales bacterium]|nr:hypothetical protein [Gemmatimonadales bacterium]
MSNTVTLITALALIALWIGLVAAQIPSGWIHLPLAIGVVQLTRWIALSEPAGASRSTEHAARRQGSRAGPPV